MVGINVFEAGCAGIWKVPVCVGGGAGFGKFLFAPASGTPLPNRNIRSSGYYEALRLSAKGIRIGRVGNPTSPARENRNSPNPACRVRRAGRDKGDGNTPPRAGHSNCFSCTIPVGVNFDGLAWYFEKISQSTCGLNASFASPKQYSVVKDLKKGICLGGRNFPQVPS